MTKQQMEETGYHGALFDCYHFLRNYADKAENTETFWNSAVQEAFNISQKYDGTIVSKFVNGLLSATYDELKAIRDRQKPSETADRKGGDIN